MFSSCPCGDSFGDSDFPPIIQKHAAVDWSCQIICRCVCVPCGGLMQLLFPGWTLDPRSPAQDKRHRRWINYHNNIFIYSIWTGQVDLYTINWINNEHCLTATRYLHPIERKRSEKGKWIPFTQNKEKEIKNKHVGCSMWFCSITRSQRKQALTLHASGGWSRML